MTKRLLALFLVCILAIPIMGVPVYATSTEETEATEPDYTNILDVISQNTWDIRARLTAILNEIQGNVSGWNVHSLLTSIKDSCSNIYSVLREKMQSLVDGISDIYDAITTTIFSFLGEITTNIGNILSEIVTIGDNIAALVGGKTEDTEDFQQQIATESTEMQEALEEIEQATIPDYESIDTDFDYAGTGMGRYYSNIIRIIFTNSATLTTVFVVAFTFAMISYVFFGKR